LDRQLLGLCHRIRTAVVAAEVAFARIAAPHVGGRAMMRAYEAPAPAASPGEESQAQARRVLVDRLWPRGLKKEAAALDPWAKDLAPSNELRKWFGHDPERWAEFKRRYTAELRQHTELLGDLRALAWPGTVTLIYPSRDESTTKPVVLRDVLLGQGQNPTAYFGGDRFGGLRAFERCRRRAGILTKTDVDSCSWRVGYSQASVRGRAMPSPPASRGASN
jgi:uncharacterized protein YeaO (DUF488 family)